MFRRLLLLLAAIAPSWTVDAATFDVLETGLCIERLQAADGAGRGIATGRLADEVWVALCDGGWARVAPDGGGTTDRPPRLLAVPEDSERLPDAQITRAKGAIAAAWLIDPTDRYRHGVLGDAIEAGGLRVFLRDGTFVDARIDSDSVFEDLRVRLADLTGDGVEELIVVRSDLARGGALSIWGLRGNRLARLAETPPIGTANRWLNPAGAADFDGDGRIEIAHVETPHIGGVLHLHELDGGRLRPDGSMPGFSNHFIGSRELAMAAVADWNSDGLADLALPDATRRRLMVVGMPRGSLESLAVLPLPARIVTAILATDFNGDGVPELAFALENGHLVLAVP